ncbi:hypothetical protein CASFOL_010607 [Castilleja foliolosa]|uniref:Uncharacterized protein n=1 Tax=Castilleja foliolosa TaxID=1961234 RepID=A0ABD3DV05_9LAMI
MNNLGKQTLLVAANLSIPKSSGVLGADREWHKLLPRCQDQENLQSICAENKWLSRVT